MVPTCVSEAGTWTRNFLVVINIGESLVSLKCLVVDEGFPPILLGIKERKRKEKKSKRKKGVD